MAFGDDRVLEIVLRARDEASKVIKSAGRTISADLAATGQAAQQLTTGMLVASTAVAGFMGYGAKVAGDLEAARQGFVTLLGSTKLADEAIARIKRDAATTPFELPGLINANQLLTSITKDSGRSESLLLNVGKALSAMGKGQPELDRIIANLQQIGATGKITELDVRQFGMSGVNVLELLADYYGTTQAKASEMVKNSTDGFGDLEKAFAKAGSGGGRFAKAFENQAGTFNQLLSNLKDSFNIFASEVVINSGLFDLLKQAMASAAPWLTQLGSTLKTTVIPAIKEFFSHRENVIGFIYALVAVLALAVGAFVATHAILLLLIAAMGVVGLAVRELYVAWESNTFGIRDTTTAAFSFITGVLIPSVQRAFSEVVSGVNWLKGHWAEAIGFMIGFFLTLPIKIPIYMLEAIRRAVEILYNVNWGAALWGLYNSWVNTWNQMIGFVRRINWGQVMQGVGQGVVAGIPGLGGALHTLRVPGFADGGWVGATGLALVHQGEYVLSKNMLAGRQSIAAPVTNNNSPITIGPVYVQREADIDQLTNKLAYLMQTRGSL